MQISANVIVSFHHRSLAVPTEPRIIAAVTEDVRRMCIFASHTGYLSTVFNYMQSKYILQMTDGN